MIYLRFSDVDVQVNIYFTLMNAKLLQIKEATIINTTSDYSEKQLKPEAVESGN